MEEKIWISRKLAEALLASGGNRDVLAELLRCCEDQKPDVFKTHRQVQKEEKK